MSTNFYNKESLTALERCKERLRSCMYDIAVAAEKQGCREYGIYLNRGEDGIEYCSLSKNKINIMMDLYCCIVKNKSPMCEKSFSLDPEHITKIYYHAMQCDAGVMVIGVLADRKKKDAEFILEEVV